MMKIIKEFLVFVMMVGMAFGEDFHTTVTRDDSYVVQDWDTIAASNRFAGPGSPGTVISEAGDIGKFLRADGTWQSASGGGTSTWGQVYGDITNQTDLISYLYRASYKDEYNIYSNSNKFDGDVFFGDAAYFTGLGVDKGELRLSSGNTLLGWNGNGIFLSDPNGGAGALQISDAQYMLEPVSNRWGVNQTATSGLEIVNYQTMTNQGYLVTNDLSGYVQSADTNGWIVTSHTNFVEKTGDTMSGPLGLTRAEFDGYYIEEKLGALLMTDSGTNRGFTITPNYVFLGNTGVSPTGFFALNVYSNSFSFSDGPVTMFGETRTNWPGADHVLTNHTGNVSISGEVSVGSLDVAGTSAFHDDVTADTTLSAGDLVATNNVDVGNLLTMTPYEIQTALTASDADAGDQLGFSCSLSSDSSTLAVGATGWDNAAISAQGAVYVFDWNGGAWVERTTALTSSDGASSDYFGSSCSLSSDGSILAVGAMGWNDKGSIYVFDWNGDTWVERTTALTASDEGPFDRFGSSCSLSSDGNILSVGASGWDDLAGFEQGAMYIFDWNGSSWVERTTALTASDADINAAYFGSGCSLSSDGSILAVGAERRNGGAGVEQGAMYVLDWNGSSWTERTTALTASDAGAYDRFGSDCSLSSDGRTLAVGATFRDGSAGSNQGAMYIFDWNGSSWVERITELTASDAGSSDVFGSGCSLSSDGSILAVGAWGWRGSAGSNQGAVYGYRLFPNAYPSTSSRYINADLASIHISGTSTFGGDATADADIVHTISTQAGGTSWTYWAVGGVKAAEGSWRQGVDNSNLVTQVYLSGAWTNAVEFTRP